MATQGVLSIVSEYGGTIIKAVCGANGFEVPAAAKAVKQQLPDIDIRKMFDICKACGLATLVVMDNRGNVLVDETAEGSGRLPDLYYEKFNDPEFNPRWSNGTAAYVELVKVI